MATQQHNIMDDQTVAADLLSSAKAAVKQLASALTEAATPEVRQTFQSQLNEAVSFQHKVADFVVEKGWYKPYDIETQIQMDVQSSQQKLQNLQRTVQ
ncbi:MAG: spore coat protein [Bacillota bacterium]|nr:spore coat protein [Bacillota bacterium]